eukprot:204737_1
MNDLRSLEGVGQLLSQKFHQTNRNKLRSKHIRRKSSVPMMISSPTPTHHTNTTPISEYFPPEIASLLSANIQMGYYRQVASQAPVLLKSHSDFVREDTLTDFSDSSFVCYDDHSHSNDRFQYEEDDVVVLHLPQEIKQHNPSIPSMTMSDMDSRELSESFALPPSLAPLILDADEENESDTQYDIVHYIEEQEDELDVELFDLKGDFMEYQSRHTKHAFNNIGNGASGIVRKAFHYKSCQMVAIKKCRSRQKHETDAFIKEGRLYDEFQHVPNIINMMGFGKDVCDGDLCIALEYMDLGSCDTLRIHETMGIKDREVMVGYIMWNVLHGLHELHQQLYVHNDVKPANVLCNKYGEIKLSDFGTVLRLSDKYSYLCKNTGTQRYQSPEKLTKQICKYNTKTDIWSVGITCYELLFGARNDPENEVSYVTNPPQLSPKKHKLSAHCCDFIAQCLVMDEKQRLSAQELLTHPWFTQHIAPKPLSDQWFYVVDLNEKGMNKSKKKKVKHLATDFRQHEFYNEDLLFMISALIINYSKQNVNLELDECLPQYHAMLHRRVSHLNAENHFTDDQRIANMARCALCSKEMVIDRIRVTVAHIKSQLNKAEVSRIDS